MQAALEFAPGFKVFGANRFFKKQRVVRRQGIAQLHGLCGLENFGVRIKSQLVLRFNGLAQLAEILGRRANHFAPAVAVHVQPVGAELESFDAPLRIQCIHGVTRLGRIGRGVHAGINLHLVTHMAAHQLVHRHTQRFGRNIPQTMVDGRNCGQPECPRRKAGLLHQVLVNVGDAPRVLAPDKVQQVFKQRKQGQVRTMVVALTPAGDALVGVHGQQHARAVFVARHENAQSINLHCHQPLGK